MEDRNKWQQMMKTEAGLIPSKKSLRFCLFLVDDSNLCRKGNEPLGKLPMLRNQKRCNPIHKANTTAHI
ncbi:hypothetical protein EG353_19745 [Chryseobacterium shandongense]|uniref:Transposase IS701-like DDE domain-containing protein n=1 Tax=Chryseobacterium shandongense TaxID=1493872 RepID=A0ABN5S3Z6_9FLAO|nr:hypothetical protein EG353_19745 [Chryseobacterium shandongense]